MYTADPYIHAYTFFLLPPTCRRPRWYDLRVYLSKRPDVFAGDVVLIDRYEYDAGLVARFVAVMLFKFLK